MPADRIWLYNILFLPPVTAACSAIFACVVNLTARLFHGRGSFAGQFALFSFAYPPVILLMLVSTWVLRILDLDQTLLFPLASVPILIACFFIIALSVKVEQNLRWKPALACFFAGFPPAIRFTPAFIR